MSSTNATLHTPAILHAAWRDDRLLLWGETAGGPADDPRATLTPKAVPETLPPPEPVTLVLPGRKGVPAPSSTLLDAPAPTGRVGLVPCTIPAVVLQPGTAAKLLVGIDRHEYVRPNVHLGPDIAYWRLVLQWAAAFLVRQDVVPDLDRIDDDTWRPCWRPWFRAEEYATFADLALAMPPACLAHHDPELFRNRKQLAKAAGSLLLHVTRLLVDALCRDATASLPETQHFDPQESHHDAWLAGLCTGNDPTPAKARPSAIPIDDLDLPSRTRRALQRHGLATASDLAALSEEDLYQLPGIGAASLRAVAAALARLGMKLRPAYQPVPAVAVDLAALALDLPDWHARLQPDDWGGLRLCFRLEEPTGRRKLWRITFLVQALNDPSLLVEARILWQGEGEILGRHLDRPAERLLVALDRAGRLFPPLAAALRGRQPAYCRITTDEAYAFLREGAWLLEEEGFGILLPAWWTGKRQGLTARARVATGSEPGPGGLNDILAFDWEMALGDTVISREELERLAALKTPLVQLHGQWVEVRPDEIEKALAFWRKRETQTMRAGDALALGLGGEQEIDGVRFTGLEAQGWLGEVIAGLEAGETIQPVAPPSRLRGTLRPYQQRGLAWLHFLGRFGLGACLADDMGLGKTIQALALILKHREEGIEGPVLLVCPTSVLGNWQREADRFAPDLTVLLHHGPDRRTGTAFLDAAAGIDMVLTSFALALRDNDTLRQVSWAGIIVDEAHTIKNPETKQSKAIRRLPARYRVAMTGTPVENSVMDLWAIMEFCNPGYLGNQNHFKRRFLTPIQRHGDETAAAHLRRVTGPFILRRLKTDKRIIRDLPEKQEMDVFVPLTKEQASLYQAVVADAERTLAGLAGIQRRGVILATLTRLKQVCNHPAHFLGQRRPLQGRSGKLSRLEEMLAVIRDAGDSALVFTQFREMGELLTDRLRSGLGVPVFFLHGGVSRRKRDRMVEEFQTATQPAIMVLSIKAGGTGLNLTRACHVFHFDRWWNPAVEDQATDRAFRIGQRRTVQVHKFVCQGTVEERIAHLLTEKRDLAQRIVGTGEGWITELSTEELRRLFRLEPGAVEED